MSTKTQHSVQAVQNYGMITFWLMIISSFLEFCYVGIITRFIGLIFLGLTLYKISLLVEDNSIINTYLLAILTLCIPILPFILIILSIVYAGRKTGINEFVGTATWWVASILLPLALLLFLFPVFLLLENIDSNSVLVDSVIVIGLLFILLVRAVIEIYAMLQWRAGLQRIAEMFTYEDGLVQS